MCAGEGHVAVCVSISGMWNDFAAGWQTHIKLVKFIIASAFILTFFALRLWGQEIKNKTALEAEVRWKLRENSKLQCFLIQFISFRGEASFSSSSPRSDYVWPPLAQPASLHPPSAVLVWSVSCINQHISLGLMNVSSCRQKTSCFQSLQPSNEELHRKAPSFLSLKSEKPCSPLGQNTNHVDYTGKHFLHITNNKQMGQIWGEMLLEMLQDRINPHLNPTICSVPHAAMTNASVTERLSLLYLSFNKEKTKRCENSFTANWVYIKATQERNKDFFVCHD